MEEPLRILQTCFSASWGGLEMQAIELSRQLSARGHAVWLAAPPQTRLAAAAAQHPFHLLELPVHGYLHPILLGRLARFLRRERIDLIHCQHSRDLATVIPARQFAGGTIPVILSKRMGSYIAKKDLFHRYTYGRVRFVLAISEVIHRNVLDTTPMEPDQVLTLHDAVDLSLFDPTRTDRTAARASFGIGDDIPVIGFVGRFSPGKGIEDLLHAARLLADQGLAFRLVIVGESSHGEEAYGVRIRALAADPALHGHVHLAGFRSDIPATMAAFDIFAFPSHAEAFGVVLIEAMAMGKPVVCTDCDGVVDIVVDGTTGIMVPARSAADLATALARLLADPALRARMGTAGRHRVEGHFDQARQIDRLVGIYRTVIGEGKRSGREMQPA